MHIEAIVLGSGTSNGVPTLGIDYSETFLANPKNHRTRCALLLRSATTTLLVDCGPEMRLQLLREEVKMVDAVLVTHSHADHIMGMDDLRAFCLKSGRDMPIYANTPTISDIQRVFSYAFNDFPPGIEVPRFKLFEVGENLTVGDLDLQIIPVTHGKIEVLALRVGDLAYITDVSSIPKHAYEQLRGLKTLILDAVRIKPHPNHFHLERSIQEAQKIGAQTTYFTHLSHDFDHDLSEAKLPNGIKLAFDGLKIAIST